MAKVACLHHLEHPFTGHAGAVLADAGVELVDVDLRRGDPLPQLDSVDGLLSYGGEQSVTEIERHPYLVAEVELLREAVERGVPVFGICLGGQLLAHALGGRVRPMTARTVAWKPIEALPAAADDPAFGAVPAGAHALHWNEDCFDPPDGAVELLARVGEGCEAFRLGERAWGVQFHPEVSAEALEDWYGSDAEWLAEAGVAESDARAEDQRFLPGQRPLCDAIFGGFAKAVRSAREPAY
jgi:GMP synthase-like glutamine amidotransferase